MGIEVAEDCSASSFQQLSEALVPSDIVEFGEILVGEKFHIVMRALTEIISSSLVIKQDPLAGEIEIVIIPKSDKIQA